MLTSVENLHVGGNRAFAGYSYVEASTAELILEPLTPDETKILDELAELGLMTKEGHRFRVSLRGRKK